MQPQQTPPTPGSGQYGFMFQNKPSGGNRLSLPKLNLPRPIKLGLVAVFILLLLVLLFGLKGSSTNNTPGMDVAARQHEILRVSKLAVSSVKDQQVQNMVSNVVATFTTDQAQTTKSLGVKAGDARLNKYLSKSTDTSLQTAGQNNNYDTAYLTWLKQSLTAYQQAIQSTLPTGSARQTLAEPYQADSQDAQSLLASSLFKNL